MTMQATAIILWVLILQCPATGQELVNPSEINRIKQLLKNDDNKFYPPLRDVPNGTSPLVFGLIMSFGGNIDSSGSIPGVRVALDRINSNSSLLPGYSLHYALSDSRCYRPQAIKAFFEQVPYSEPKKIALIGGGCSVASEPIAEFSPNFNIMQVSCVTASPMLSNRARFPNYFQLLPSLVDLSPSYIGIIKEFKWRHVVIYLQDENLFTLTVNRLKVSLDKENVTYSIHIFNSDDGLRSLDNEPFSHPDERIYIIASYVPYARELICQAYHHNIRYPTHSLLTFQWYNPQWWLVDDQDSTCTGEQRGQVLNRALSMAVYDTSYVDRENYNTTMNITGKQFYFEENQHLGNSPFNFTQFKFARYCHDATWALAWSLHRTMEEEGLDLSVVDYQNANLTRIMLQHMNNSFTGLSGKVEFNEHGARRPHRLQVFQFRKGGNGILHRTEIGSIVTVTHNSNYTLQYLPNESGATLWPNNLVPYDGRPTTVIDTVSLVLVMVIFLLAVIGAVLAVICLAFNLAYRNTRIVQISRPRLNYIIILGAILFYFTMILLAIPTSNKSVFVGLLKTIPWTMALGFSLCYGTIIMKMLRVYYIVNNPLPNKNIKDWALILGILLFVMIDLILLLLNTIISETTEPSRVVLVPNKENPRTVAGELQVSTDHMIYVNESSIHYIFTTILYGYKGLLQLIALLLAFRTRNIKVKGLDNAKYIISTVYITTIGIVIIAMASYLLREYLNVYTAVVTLSLFSSTSVILGLIFIPKMIALSKDPKGEKVFKKYETPSLKSQQTQHQTELTTGSTDSALKLKIQELEKQGTNVATDPHTPYIHCHNSNEGTVATSA